MPPPASELSPADSALSQLRYSLVGLLFDNPQVSDFVEQFAIVVYEVDHASKEIIARGLFGVPDAPVIKNRFLAYRHSSVKGEIALAFAEARPIIIDDIMDSIGSHCIAADVLISRRFVAFVCVKADGKRAEKFEGDYVIALQS